jgi:hypothetical protein
MYSHVNIKAKLFVQFIKRPRNTVDVMGRSQFYRFSWNKLVVLCLFYPHTCMHAHMQITFVNCDSSWSDGSVFIEACDFVVTQFKVRRC